MRRPVMPPEPPDEAPATGEAVMGPATGAEAGTTEIETQENAAQDVPAGAEHTLFDGRLGTPGTWAGRWRTLTRLPVTLMLSSVLLGLGIVQLTFHLGNSLYRSFTWSQEIRQTDARVQALQRDVNILRDAEKAAQDPAYLEQLARCQGYVRKTESVVVSTDPPTAPSENCQVVRLP